MFSGDPFSSPAKPRNSQCCHNSKPEACSLVKRDYEGGGTSTEALISETNHQPGAPTALPALWGRPQDSGERRRLSSRASLENGTSSVQPVFESRGDLQAPSCGASEYLQPSRHSQVDTWTKAYSCESTLTSLVEVLGTLPASVQEFFGIGTQELRDASQMYVGERFLWEAVDGVPT